MGRGPCTFKKSDVTRAVEAVIAAGIAVQKVEIDCEAKKIISGKPPEEPNTSAEWDDLSCGSKRENDSFQRCDHWTERHYLERRRENSVRCP